MFECPVLSHWSGELLYSSSKHFHTWKVFGVMAMCKGSRNHQHPFECLHWCLIPCKFPRSRCPLLALILAHCPWNKSHLNRDLICSTAGSGLVATLLLHASLSVFTLHQLTALQQVMSCTRCEITYNIMTVWRQSRKKKTEFVSSSWYIKLWWPSG